MKRKHERREVHRFTWFYRNSLLVAFLLLFVLALGLHIVFGTAYNEEITLAGQPPISITAHLSASARFAGIESRSNPGTQQPARPTSERQAGEKRMKV